VTDPRILLAGDHFVLNRLLAADLAAADPDGAWDVGELELPWPHEPFSAVAEVDEASGDEEQMIEALAGARVCLTQVAPLTARVLDACPDLELYAVSRGGPVNVNLEAATEHGVAVTFAPGRNAAATAEYAVGLMLAAMRRIPHTHAGVLAGRWESDLYAYDATGLELEGTTVGLVGVGAVGSRVARILQAFGADVVAHDPYVDPATLPGVRFAELDELLAASRVLSLHARVTDETRGMIGAAEIAALPAGSVLINDARGALLDHAALAAALRDGHLFAAGLDVFDVEPLPADHPLRDAPNLIMTPHLAGASRATAERASRIVAAEAARWRRGEPPEHCANPDVLERLTVGL
jgi:D-3-phosphoglycerate dehydrogenase / 2-oxoglutarate reductase